MTHRVIGLVLASVLVITAGQSRLESQQCTRYVEVENQSGANPSGITFYFAGFAPSGAEPPSLVPDESPVCGLATVGGDLGGQLSFGWLTECVDHNALLTIWFLSSEAIPDISSGSWSDSTSSYPIPAEDLELSPDCNLNCIDDSLDISSGFSADRNLNGVPDECESVASIPSIGAHGAILLATLLLASALFVIRRRVSSS